jgi:hypothetical protein
MPRFSSLNPSRAADENDIRLLFQVGDLRWRLGRLKRWLWIEAAAIVLLAAIAGRLGWIVATY